MAQKIANFDPVSSELPVARGFARDRFWPKTLFGAPSFCAAALSVELAAGPGPRFDVKGVTERRVGP